MLNVFLKCRKMSARTFVLATMLLFSLSACGGGGSSGGLPTLTINPGGVQLAKAAANEPKSGSITQGTRGLGGVSADTVSWDNGSVRIADSQTLSPDGDVTLGVGRAKRFNGQNALSVVASGVRATTPTSGTDDLGLSYDASDPLVFGLWAYYEESSGEVVWGVFADGQTVTETPASYISAESGTVQYEGKTFGAYENVESFGELNPDSGVFIADVELTADFGASSVSGKIRNFVGDDSPEPSGLDSFIMLKDASISPGEDGGFFKGDTALVNGVNEDPNFSGKWGGKFFGEEAEHIGGTWGVSSDDYSAVGAFSVTK